MTPPNAAASVIAQLSQRLLERASDATYVRLRLGIPAARENFEEPEQLEGNGTLERYLSARTAYSLAFAAAMTDPTRARAWPFESTALRSSMNEAWSVLKSTNTETLEGVDPDIERIVVRSDMSSPVLEHDGPGFSFFGAAAGSLAFADSARDLELKADLAVRTLAHAGPPRRVIVLSNLELRSSDWGRDRDLLRAAFLWHAPQVTGLRLGFLNLSGGGSRFEDDVLRCIGVQIVAMI